MLDTTRLVFIDETAVSTNLVRLRGRAPRGVRLIGCVPLGKWETITFVAALRHDRMTAPRAHRQLAWDCRSRMALQPTTALPKPWVSCPLIGDSHRVLIGNATTGHPGAGKGHSAREGPERYYACLPPFHSLSHRIVRDCRSRMALQPRPSVSSTPFSMGRYVRSAPGNCSENHRAVAAETSAISAALFLLFVVPLIVDFGAG